MPKEAERAKKPILPKFLLYIIRRFPKFNKHFLEKSQTFCGFSAIFCIRSGNFRFLSFFFIGNAI